MTDEFERKQLAILDAMDKMADAGGYLEHLALINGVKQMRSLLFDLSYESAYKKAMALEKKLCESVGDWNEYETECKCKFTTQMFVCSRSREEL